MRIPDQSGELVVASWRETEIPRLLGDLAVVSPRPGVSARPAVLAVDGRSGAGKSTLARRLVAEVPDSAVVATDDIAWHFSMFDWTAELISYVIEPVRRGEPVHYRPPGWVLKDRPGALTILPERSLLVVEGVGSSQRSLARAIDAAIWVQSDAVVARERGIERDVVSGVNGDRSASVAFWDDWAAAEEPFLARDAPWSRADVIVAGVPLADTTPQLLCRDRAFRP